MNNYLKIFSNKFNLYMKKKLLHFGLFQLILPKAYKFQKKNWKKNLSSNRDITI